MIEHEVDHNDAEDLVQSHSTGLTIMDLQKLDTFIEHDSEEQKQNQDLAIPIQKSKNFILP
jgi:hypothetical protein